MGSSSDADDNHRHRVATGDLCHNTAASGCNDDASENNNEARRSIAYAQIHTEHRDATALRHTSRTASSGSAPDSSQLQPGGRRPRPQITFTKNSQPLRSSALFDPYTRQQDENAGHDDDDAVRRAIELSLADQATAASPARPSSPVDESHVQNDFALVKSRSLFTTANATASTSKPPHAPLGDIISSMDATAEDLENRAEQARSVNPWILAGYVREWEGTLTQVKHRIEAAERGRREDLQLHIKFDTETQEEHRRQMDRVNWTWQGKLHDKQMEWAREMEQQREEYKIGLGEQQETYRKELEEQMQIYEREIARQTVESLETANVEPLETGRGRTHHRSRFARALSPSPTTTTRPRADSTVACTTHTNGHGEHEAGQTATSTLSQRKSKPFALQNTTLPERSNGKANDQNSEAESSETTPQAFEARSYQHKNRAERRLAATYIQGKRRQWHKRDCPADSKGSETSDSASRSPEKRKQDDEGAGAPESRSWSPKKTKSK